MSTQTSKTRSHLCVCVLEHTSQRLEVESTALASGAHKLLDGLQVARAHALVRGNTTQRTSSPEWHAKRGWAGAFPVGYIAPRVVTWQLTRTPTNR